MRNILTIAGKEFKSYFKSPGLYFITGLYTLLLSFVYNMILRDFSRRSLQSMQFTGHGEGGNIHREIFVGHISTVHLVLLFLIPFLTMKLLAEEKKMRTFDLLLTSPVTATDIVLGKLLAVTGITWVLVALSSLYCIGTAFFTPVQWGPLASAYLGLLFLVTIYVAIGMFASSLTENLILAGFIAIILSIGLLFMGSLSNLVEDAPWTSIAKHISVMEHFGQFIQGNIQVAGLTFFLSVIALYAFLTQRVVESERWR